MLTASEKRELLESEAQRLADEMQEEGPLYGDPETAKRIANLASETGFTFGEVKHEVEVRYGRVLVQAVQAPAAHEDENWARCVAFGASINARCVLDADHVGPHQLEDEDEREALARVAYEAYDATGADYSMTWLDRWGAAAAAVAQAVRERKPLRVWLEAYIERGALGIDLEHLQDSKAHNDLTPIGESALDRLTSIAGDLQEMLNGNRPCVRGGWGTYAARAEAEAARAREAIQEAVHHDKHPSDAQLAEDLDYPPALVRACAGDGSFACRLRVGGIVRFRRARPLNAGWVSLRGCCALHDGDGDVDLVLEVHLADIVCVAILSEEDARG